MQSKFLILLVTCCILMASSCKEDTPTTPFQGCTTPNTASISTTRMVEEMRQAMLQFRTSLSEDLLNQASNCLEDDRYVLWHNTPPAVTARDGITYGDLTATQLANFKNLLQLFLSTEGYQKVDEITFLAEGFLNQIDPNFWSTDQYSIDMFGDPENSGSWGFQLDGHHCAINFLVHGDNVSMVPAFLGGEPVKGTHNGITFDIFKDERDLALVLYNGFSNAENTVAVSTGSSATMVVGPAPNGGEADPFRGEYDYSRFKTGLKFTDMSTATQANLILVMQEYVYNLNTSFADIWWADIMGNINDTYFVWLDEVASPNTTTQFYYRIYNPYLWIEYNMEPPVGESIEDWNHVHSITRIPNNPTTTNGGDYGLFAQIINQAGPRTLYEHYYHADHHKTSRFLFDYRVSMKVGYEHLHKHDHGHPHQEG